MPDDTAPIRPEERFDEQTVARYLRAAVPELVRDSEIVFDQFPGGAANLTYRATAGSTELVLRRAPLGAVAKGGHDMEREYTVLSRLWERFAQAPRAFHYCADPDVMGKPFFVMERRHGHVVRSAWPEHLGERDDLRRRVTEDLVDTLAQLHSVEAADIGLGDLGRPSGFVERQVEGWAGRWEAAKTRELPDIDRVIEALRGSVPDGDSATILHNDYKLDNVMISDQGVVVAVLDWDMATRGDAMVDLGTMLAYWFDVDGPATAVFGRLVQPLTPFMPRIEVVERYATASGRDMSDIRFYVALAYYRIAVIIEQIYARFVRGQTTDERFAGYEPAAPVLAGLALGTISGDLSI